MTFRKLRKYLFGLMLASLTTSIIAQDNVPLGIHYQAVARDNYGKEIVNKKISVKFSVISDNPLGTVVYQELHQDVVTSKYGVFSIIIGKGTPTGNTPCGELSQITWESACHYLKVEVKFENDFMDMGTMQFLAVPYALFAKKSLEPGPEGPAGPTGATGLQGPKGDQGLKGDAGAQGSKGDSGVQGPKGDPGAQGPKGDTGAEGPKGDTGTQGPEGDPGAQGPKGDTGAEGPKGDTGAQGLTGDTGAQGPKGDPGAQGLKGDTGAQGPKGDPGAQGLTGDTGAQGPKGDTGAQGLKGDTGAQGPKGDPGDPATDDQTLSVVNIEGADYLAISGGNQVKISNIERDGDPANEIQDLIINSDKLKITDNANAVEWDLSPYRQTLAWDPLTSVLNISGSSSPVNLSGLKNDDDADPGNEIQDISLSGNLLTITKNSSSVGVDLGKYLDNEDRQQLTFNSTDHTLSLTNSAPVDLISLINDADADPVNEIQNLSLESDLLSISGANNVNLAAYRDNTDNQTLSYLESSTSKSLSVSGGNSVTIDNLVAFRAEKDVSVSVTSTFTDTTFIPTGVIYNDGLSFDPSTGIFTAPVTGIFSFSISYYADGSGGARTLAIYLGKNLYEELAIEITSATLTSRSITMKLDSGEKVRLVINTGLSTQTGTGSFSGYKVY